MLLKFEERRERRAKEHRLHSETWWWEHRFSASGTGNLVKVEGAKMKEGFVKTLKKMSSSQRQNWVWVLYCFPTQQGLETYVAPGNKVAPEDQSECY